MTDLTETYAVIVNQKIRMIADTQKEVIQKAAEAFYQCTINSHKIYFFGTGHSYMMSQEAFGRAGGYAGNNFVPILEDELSMNDVIKSTYIERIAEYSNVILGLYHFMPGDAIVITSNSGRNALIVELALRLHKMGVFIIAITSSSEKVSSRHDSGKKLCDLADIVIDNQSAYGDAAVELSNHEMTGSTSTITGAFIMNAVVAEFLEKLADNQQPCPVFKSSNIDDGDAHNKEYFKRLK